MQYTITRSVNFRSWLPGTISRPNDNSTKSTCFPPTKLEFLKFVKKNIGEVKKLVDEMKNCTNATLTEQTVEKQTKPLKTSRKIFPLLIALFPSRVAGAGARV